MPGLPKRKKFISINLLPQEMIEAARKSAVAVLSERISILTVLIFVTISLAITIFYFLINNTVIGIEKRYDSAKLKVESFKNREGLLLSLQSRLDQISSISAKPQKPLDSFNIIKNLAPAAVRLLEVSLSNNNSVTLKAEASDPYSLSIFFDKLTDSEKNEGLITSAYLNGLTQGSDSRLRFDMNITLK